MKFFLDTEFIEKSNTIDLISIGIISDHDDTFYAESTGFDIRQCDQWLRENVISSLISRGSLENRRKPFDIPNSYIRLPEIDISLEVYGDNSFIGEKVIEFVCTNNRGKAEFYGYYADYDWVVFCWLFGKMIDLPKGFPMYCRDIKQMMDEKGNPKEPKQEGLEHNALSGAHYHKQLYHWINSL